MMVRTLPRRPLARFSRSAVIASRPAKPSRYVTAMEGASRTALTALAVALCLVIAPAKAAEHGDTHAPPRKPMPPMTMAATAPRQSRSNRCR